MSIRLIDSHRGSVDHHRLLHTVAVAFSGTVAALYFALFLLVMDAEQGASENTFGAYLFLTLTYAALTIVTALSQRRAVQVSGAVVQVVVLTLFVLFGIGVFGPGVFEYDELASLHMAWWATVIGALQVSLLAVFGLLARQQPTLK